MPNTVRGTGERLTEALLSQQFLKREDLDNALKRQQEQGGSLSQILVEMKLVDSRVLAGVLSQILQIPTISLSKMEIDKGLAELIPGKLAFHYQIVPVSKMGRQLTVAMADPLNVLALDHLVQATGLSLVPLITTHEEIQDTLNRLYGVAIKETLAEIHGPETSSGAVEVLAESDPLQPESADKLIRLTQEGPVVRYTHLILRRGVELSKSVKLKRIKFGSFIWNLRPS